MTHNMIDNVEFDHNSSEFVGSNYSQYRELRSRCPVAHTTNQDGFWILSKYRDVFEIARDDKTFSSSASLLIPPTDVGRLIPIQIDPPALEHYRRLLNPYLLPKAINTLEPHILRFIDSSIDSFIKRGEADFVNELANQVPACTTMQLLGLDPFEWRIFALPLHEVMYTKPGSVEHKKAEADVYAFTEKIEQEVDDRIALPRQDMISELLSSNVDGRKISREEVIDIVRMVVFGGMDTVVAALGNIFVRMAENPGIRVRLQEDRALIPTAIEEFLRFDAPIQGFARIVTKDTVIGGQQIKAGEKVFLLWASANRDEEMFGETSEELVIDRLPNRHMTFGIGGHRCQGSILARAEIRLVLNRVFDRIPDYQIMLDKIVRAETVGSSYGHRAVPAKFTPGALSSGHETL